MLLGGLIYFVYAGLRAKELASFQGRRYCQARQLQFLDETVVQQKLGFRRNQQGRLSLIRFYGFEFSSDGSRRFKGKVEVRGAWAGNIELEPYTDTRYDEAIDEAAIDVVSYGDAKYYDASQIAGSHIHRQVAMNSRDPIEPDRASHNENNTSNNQSSDKPLR